MFKVFYMEKLKVNVIIAGRTYPLSVRDTDEEQGLRRAAKHINELIATFEQNYAVADKQDVLAMCALQYASKLEISSIKDEKRGEEALHKIQKLVSLIDDQL